MATNRKISLLIQKQISKDDPAVYQIRIKTKWLDNELRFNVGYTIYKSLWNPKKGRCKAGVTNHQGTPTNEINNEIERCLDTLCKAFYYFDGIDKIPTKDDIKDYYNKATGKQSKKDVMIIIDAFNRYTIETSKIRGWSEGSIKKHSSLSVLLSESIGKRSISSSDYDTMKDFHEFLLKNGMKNTTIRKDLSLIRGFFKWCTENGLVDTNEKNGWNKYRPTIKTVSKEDVIFLTVDEFLKVYYLNIPENKKYLSKARDLFCFECATSLRYSDISALKRDQIIGNEIHVCTQKTSTGISIELNKFSREILSKYEEDRYDDNKALPPISNQKLNVWIKEVCFIAGIDTPTTKVYFRGSERIEETKPKYEYIGSHTGRRTFICLALGLGISPEKVMKWTGHTDYKQMQPYVDVAKNELVEAMKRFDDIK